ncbi:hypothetical protein [Alicyclobacillus ferrooxydans]|uniref:Thymidylate kinase-like domain-containing protein n=1 Tax=Alicyclobacillus ferrooxydans TaxID=471514 RepID=A0A0P9GP85_9BACL|nr:hypothetical protein [Alicyclobacillus ferrooxydans]KPV42417.1 hypothetical protein AN477_17605 [Alicyclobacillus ferrooxydans]
MTAGSQERNETRNGPGLLLIEGIMGAGKTTTAQFVGETLQRMGLQTKVYLEGNLEHPADYDGVAVVDEHELEAICRAYPEYAETLWSLAETAPQSGEKMGQDDPARSDPEVRVVPGEPEAVSSHSRQGCTWLIPYRKAQREMGGERMPAELVDALAKYDIYDGISLAKHAETLQASWHRFASWQRESMSTSYVFDCCFLQNPVCSFIAMHNAGADALQDHVLSLARTVLPLRPVLIYLYPTNVRETLERIIPERPKEWLEFVISYHTDQAYGHARGLSGLDGLIEFLEQRQSIEMDICKQLPFPVLIVPDPHRDWARAQADIARFLGAAGW